MKLNATTEMEPISWPEFADLHPFAPGDDAAGSLRADRATWSGWLAEITGYAAVSLQPNAGSQGELAGLLAIRAYHRCRGRGAPRRLPDPGERARHQRGVGGDGRDAGGRGRRDRRSGNVDLADLHAKIDEHRDALAAIMVTYPSTHGVFEAAIARAVRGGARGRRPGLRRRREPERAGRAGPAGRVRRRRVAPEPAQDVLHPARRRRPGRRAGRGARAPGAVPAGRPRASTACACGAVSAAPCGSPGVLPISWAYIRMMGADGLRRATLTAVAAANYVARAARRALPGAVQRASDGLRRARVHPRPAADHQGDRRDRRRRGEAAGRLRLSRADDVVPGGRHADGGADRERGPRRDRPVLSTR